MQKQKRSKAPVWWLVGGLVVLLFGLFVLLRGYTAGSSQTPAAEKTGAWLSVRLFPNGQGWAVTVRGILHTTDDGQHWADVTPWTSADYVFGGRTDELTSFSSSDQAWLILPGRTLYLKAGQKQQLELARSFHTIDGGKTWQKSSLPDTGSTYSDTQSGAGFIGGLFRPLNALGEDRGQVGIRNISTYGENQAWVAVVKTVTHTGGGQESILPLYSRIWHSNDGGITWKLVMDEKPANGNFSSLDEGWITFLNSTTGLMGGPSPDTIRVSHNGGASWKVMHLPAPRLTPLLLQRTTQQQASFFDQLHGVLSLRIMLDDQHSGIIFYTTHDGATTWQMSQMQTLAARGNAFCLSQQNWVLMPDTNSLSKTLDGGKTWHVIPMHADFPYISNLTFTTQQEGWAIGSAAQYLQGSQYNKDSATTLLKTTDGGKTWFNVKYILQF